MATIQIRQAGSGDWPTIRDICCRTGASGKPIASERWSFFGDFWIGPYQTLRPEWTLVADAAGQVAGYLTGCPDTTAFNRARFWRNRLPLMFKLLLGRYSWTSDAKRFAKRFLRFESGPDDKFPRKIRALLKADYPAHLHVNVDAQFRGGVGRMLVEEYLTRLRAAGVPGIHLFCGPDPAPFYRKLGFEELSMLEFKTANGVIPVYAFGKRLPASAVVRPEA